jgi:chitodextrinase
MSDGKTVNLNSKVGLLFLFVFLFFQHSLSNTYYVSTAGSDTQGNGSASNPWRTLRHAAANTPPGQGHIIKLTAGTFVENGSIEVPLGVSIEGLGKGLTIIKAASSFYYNPSNPGYATEKFLIRLAGYNPANGNQSLKNFTIEGDSKKLHGGIYVRYRNNVLIENVDVRYTNFTGIWLWDVKDAQLKNVNLLNCSWGSEAYCVGALNIGNLERVEISNLEIDESTGYGIKAIGPAGYNNLFHLKIRDSRISVHPYGLWNNGQAPNIAIELWQVSLVGCEIFNCYVDNTISLVNSNMPPSTGVQAIRVHHNTLDMETRANGSGYGIELTLHDVEIDHNYFIKGTQGIANWDNPVMNWNIHHNTFYGIQGIYPGEIVRSQWSGLHNVKLINNTIEFIGTRTSNVIGVYGGISNNVELRNNLIINSNTAYNHYQNQFIHRENGATINNVQVTNNLLHNLDLAVGNLLGGLLGILDPILKNTTTDPQINRTGSRPEPYYLPKTGSPLIDAGSNVGFSFQGTAPDIGAFEFGLPNTAPEISITSPGNNTNFTSGIPILISANAFDSDGFIQKVEFFIGAVKLGEDLTLPYSFTWSNVAAGDYSLTAKATDNAGAVSTSAAVTITVNATANQPPDVSIASPANNSTFQSGATITISASASDSDGTVSKVEFFSGTAKLGEDLTSPYGFTWSNVAAGDYTLKAMAYDNAGAFSTSEPVNIKVIAPNRPPQVKIISPENNAYYPPGSIVTLIAEATDTDGVVTKVEFYTDTVKLGEVLEIPFQVSWIDVEAGNYLLTAIATDNHQTVATSDTIRIVVEESEKIILYPNPASYKFFIQILAEVDQDALVTIFDPSGRVIRQLFVFLQSGLNDVEVGAGELTVGWYLVYLQTQAGNKYASRLIIVR